MAKILITILFLVLFTGCSDSAKRVVSDAQRAVGLPVAASKPPLTDAEKISLLRVDAHKRKLRWRIWCSESSSEGKFVGLAWPKADGYAIYIEDGATGDWLAYGNSQADAAANLYGLIQGEKNVQPRHKPADGDPDKCPKALSGE